MTNQAVVTAFKPSSGRVALRVEDGSFVLAEQTDANPMREGLVFTGPMREFGPEIWLEAQSQTAYEVFVLGWDLSQEAIDLEMP